MGKKKCGGGCLMQTYTALVRASQTNGIQGRVDNGPNVAKAEQEERKEEEERDVD